MNKLYLINYWSLSPPLKKILSAATNNLVFKAFKVAVLEKADDLQYATIKGAKSVLYTHDSMPETSKTIISIAIFYFNLNNYSYICMYISMF